MIRYFVTGANGFIGRHLCRVLVQNGRAVTALARAAPAPGLLPPDVRVVVATFDRPDTYGPALSECDYVIHLAGEARFGNGPQYQDANVHATRALLEAVASYAPGLRRFVFISTMGAVDRGRRDDCKSPLSEASSTHPTSDYGRSKLEGERLTSASGLPFSIVRPAMVVGPDMRVDSHVAVFARMAAEARLFSKVNWPGRVCVVHVEDLAQGIITAAENESASGRIFFAGGDSIRIGDILELAAPGRRRLGVDWLAAISGYFTPWIPFKAKVLLRSALLIDDGALRGLGWNPRFDKYQAISAVVERERGRVSPGQPPPGRTVVTGAASGLGRALAEGLARRQRRLILIDRDLKGLEEVCPGRSEVQRVACDLADEDAVSALIESPAWTAGPIAELFTCAGLGLRGTVVDLPFKEQAAIMRVNFLSRLQLVHGALGGMRAGQFGRIVLISSSSAFQALPICRSTRLQTLRFSFLAKVFHWRWMGTGSKS